MPQSPFANSASTRPAVNLTSSCGRAAFACALLACALPLASLAQAPNGFIGRIVSATGTVSIERPGQAPRLAGDGAEVSQGEFVETIGDSGARVRFRDNTELRLRPGTRMVVSDFRLDPVNPVQERFATQLIKGGLRAISGLIGKRGPANVEYRTATATVGIRGTDFIMRLCADDCVAERGAAAPPVAPPAARLVQSRGSIVAVAPNGDRRSLAEGAGVYQGEVLRTAADASATLVFRDDARVALKAGSVLGIERYAFDQARPREDSTVLRLFYGAFRAASGALGRRNPASFQVRTATATVGIRGTVFDVVCHASCGASVRNGRDSTDLNSDAIAPNLPPGLRQRLIEAASGQFPPGADRPLIGAVAAIVVGGLVADPYVAAGLSLPAPGPDAPNTARLAAAATSESAVAQATALALDRLAQQGRVSAAQLPVLKEALDAALTSPLFRDRLADTVGRAMTTPNPDWQGATAQAAALVTGAITAAASGGVGLLEGLASCSGMQCDAWRAQGPMQEWTLEGAATGRDPLPAAHAAGVVAGQALSTPAGLAAGGLIVRTDVGTTTVDGGGKITEIRAGQTAFIAMRLGEPAFIDKPAGMPGDEPNRPEDLKINPDEAFGTPPAAGKGAPGLYTFVNEGSIGVREGSAELVLQAGEGSFTGLGGLPRRTQLPAFLSSDRFLAGSAGAGQVCQAR